MSATETRKPDHGVPLVVLIGAALMVTFTIAAAFFSHSTGLGRVTPQGATPYQTLQLYFDDKPDGGVEVRDAVRGDVIDRVKPGEGGFLRATLRTFARARLRDDIGGATPFRLVRWSDGTLTIEDSTTGRSVGLDVFGPDNAGVFAKIFKQREETK